MSSVSGRGVCRPPGVFVMHDNVSSDVSGRACELVQVAGAVPRSENCTAFLIVVSHAPVSSDAFQGAKTSPRGHGHGRLVGCCAAHRARSWRGACCRASGCDCGSPWPSDGRSSRLSYALSARWQHQLVGYDMTFVTEEPARPRRVHPASASTSLAIS